MTQKTIIEKTFSWRIIASLTTFTIAWIYTGELALGVFIGGTEFIAKLFLYYIHENVWDRILARKAKP